MALALTHHVDGDFWENEYEPYGINLDAACWYLDIGNKSVELTSYINGTGSTKCM